MAQRRHVNRIGIPLVDNNAGDCLGFSQPHIGEGLSAIGRLINAVTRGRALPIIGLAGSDPDDIGILLADVNVTDRRCSIALEYRLPGRSIVYGLPNAARRQPNVDDIGIALHGDNIIYAPPHACRPDWPEPKSL